jgi:uncharacterized protein
LNMKHIGIDYGSKMAGTTAIAFSEGGALQFVQSKKKKDADQFVKSWAEEQKPELAFLDAPLSLPLVYTSQSSGSDYFYRQGDRDVGAMSPMFLGGLTARAMQLRQQLKALGCQCFETYPAQLSRVLELSRKRYKKDDGYLAEATEVVMQQLPEHRLLAPPQNWHQFDALLAYCSGRRYLSGQCDIFGKDEEGIILV